MNRNAGLRNVSDLIFDTLAARGVDTVFGMTGGAAAFLLDRLSFRNDVRLVTVAHEQAAAIMAEAFSRMRPDSLGVAIGTAGPGAANLLTGIGCAWFDSIPCLFITGQVNTYESRGERRVRQMGFQEMDIIPMARPITKLAVQARQPEAVIPLLEQAIAVARSGRPGPVLIDLPMNLQRQEIDPGAIAHFIPAESPAAAGRDHGLAAVPGCLAWLREATRPVLLAGGGIRRSGATSALKRLAERLAIPVCLSMNGIDAFPHDHPLYAGFLGVYGNRSANFAVANSDLLLVVGSRLDSRQTGAKAEYFARGARKIVVDIDPEELGARIVPEVAVAGDARVFLEALEAAARHQAPPDRRAWCAQIAVWKEKYPAAVPAPGGELTPYGFLALLSGALADQDVVTLDTGQNMVQAMQVIETREQMRMFTAGGMSPMGYSFPAAIGAACADRSRRVVAVIGDGGMQLCIQELETLRRLNLPVKVFVINNRTLGLIRQFQDDYLGKRHVGTSGDGGYSAPDFSAVARAYGIPSRIIEATERAAAGIREALAASGPFLCDVRVAADCNVVPKALVNQPVEDQYPYLEESELRANLRNPVDPGSYRTRRPE